jgi:DNA-binding Xre family transcriptional regulator
MRSNIKVLMENRGITLRGLMAETGLANKTVLNARADEKIETCTLRTLRKIAQALDCGVKDLFEEEEKNKG